VSTKDTFEMPNSQMGFLQQFNNKSRFNRFKSPEKVSNLPRMVDAVSDLKDKIEVAHTQLIASKFEAMTKMSISPSPSFRSASSDRLVLSY